jgi:hypothetical protein
MELASTPAQPWLCRFLSAATFVGMMVFGAHNPCAAATAADASQLAQGNAI